MELPACRCCKFMAVSRLDSAIRGLNLNQYLIHRLFFLLCPQTNEFHFFIFELWKLSLVFSRR